MSFTCTRQDVCRIEQGLGKQERTISESAHAEPRSRDDLTSWLASPGKLDCNLAKRTEK